MKTLIALLLLAAPLAAQECPELIQRYLIGIRQDIPHGQDWTPQKDCTYSLAGTIPYQAISDGYMIASAVPFDPTDLETKPAILRTSAHYQARQRLTGQVRYVGTATFTSMAGFEREAFIFEPVAQ